MSVRRTTVLLGLILAAAVALIYWSLRITVVDPASVASSEAPAGPLEVHVVDGELGRSVDLPARYLQPPASPLANFAAGTLTSTAASPGAAITIADGAVVYTVDHRPVVAIMDDALVVGPVESGGDPTDVATVQRFLSRQGYDPGPADGRFGAATRRAVRAWRAAMGLPPGDALSPDLFVSVPTGRQVRVDQDVWRGMQIGLETTVLVATERVGAVLADIPVDQQSLFPAGSKATIALGGSSVTAELSDYEGPAEAETGNILLEFTSDGMRVCAIIDCSTLQDGEQMTVEVEVVPNVRGPMLPVAAIREAGDGSLFVVRADGSRTDVLVRAADGGVAVVDGVNEGETVLLGP